MSRFRAQWGYRLGRCGLWRLLPFHHREPASRRRCAFGMGIDVLEAGFPPRSSFARVVDVRQFAVAAFLPPPKDAVRSLERVMRRFDFSPLAQAAASSGEEVRRA